MIKPRPNFIQSLGFTMIELLIVISILGFLAVAVLAAINPIEQINRGKDTGSRSDAEQLVSAIDRYYSSNGFYPWVTSATSVNNGTSATGGVTSANAVLVPFSTTPAAPTDGTCAWDAKLTQGVTGCTGSDELKATFTTRVMNATYNTLQVFNRGTQGDSTYVCFIPKSRQFLTEANARCVDENGTGLPADLRPIGATVCAGAGTGTGTTLSCLP